MILVRYIMKRLFCEVLATLMVVSALLFVWLLLGKALLIGSWLQLKLLLLGNLFAMPAAMVKVFPWVMLFSIMRCLMHMAIDYEWTMMASLGFNRTRILVALNTVMLGLACLFLVVSQVVAPVSMVTANHFFCHEGSVKQCPLRKEGWAFHDQQMIHYHLNMQAGLLGPITIYMLNTSHDAVEGILHAPIADPTPLHGWHIHGTLHRAGGANERVSMPLQMPFTPKELQLLSLKWRQLPAGLAIKLSIQNNFEQHASMQALIKYVVDHVIWLSGAMLLINLFALEFLRPLPIQRNHTTLHKKTIVAVVIFLLCLMLYHIYLT